MAQRPKPGSHETSGIDPDSAMMTVVRRLLHCKFQLHPFALVILHRTGNVVGAGLEIGVEHFHFIRREVGEELLLEAFTFNLEVVLLLTGRPARPNRDRSPGCGPEPCSFLNDGILNPQGIGKIG